MLELSLLPPSPALAEEKASTLYLDRNDATWESLVPFVRKSGREAGVSLPGVPAACFLCGSCLFILCRRLRPGINVLSLALTRCLPVCDIAASLLRELLSSPDKHGQEEPGSLSVLLSTHGPRLAE